jgi:hypothetical protein
MNIVQSSAFIGLTFEAVRTFLSVIASHNVMCVCAFVYRILNVAAARRFRNTVGHGLHY